MEVSQSLEVPWVHCYPSPGGPSKEELVEGVWLVTLSWAGGQDNSLSLVPKYTCELML